MQLLKYSYLSKFALATSLATAITSSVYSDAYARTQSDQTSIEGSTIAAQAQSINKPKPKSKNKKKIIEAKKFLTLRLNERMANEDYEGALALCQQALQEDSNNEVALFYTAFCHYKQKSDIAIVLEELNKSINIEPGFIKALMARACIHHEKNNQDLALKDFETVVALEPNNLDAIMYMINIHKQGNDISGLASDYSKWIAANPEGTQAYYCRAKCYRSLGMFSDAIADLKKVSEILVYEYRGSENAQVLGLISEIEQEQAAVA